MADVFDEQGRPADLFGPHGGAYVYVVTYVVGGVLDTLETFATLEKARAFTAPLVERDELVGNDDHVDSWISKDEDDVLNIWTGELQ